MDFHQELSQTTPKKSPRPVQGSGPAHNSTSSKAWQAILSGFRSHPVTGVNETYSSKKDYTGIGTPFVDNFIPSGDEGNLYAGHRRLAQEELENLSNELIEEIRNRGAANTLGQFINRSKDSSNINEQHMSRIDKAIMEAKLNLTQRVSDSTDSPEDVRARPDEKEQASMAVANLAMETGAGLPGYLKQQDILRPLAPIMTTRGDTFTIRSYGESVNPVTGETNGMAWCEAVVQRVPDYVDSSTDAWDIPTISSLNEKFGRRFKIIQFRWLSEDDVS